VDDQQASVIEFDRHHFQSNTLPVVPEVHQPRLGAGRRSDRRRLLESQTGMLDDVANPLPSDPMLAR